MKKLLAAVAVLVILLALVAVGLLLSLNPLVLKTVNGAAPAALGVPVTLAEADIALLRGHAALKNLHIGNPEGFKTDGLLDLGSITVNIDNSTLLSDTIVIKEILIDGLVLTFEKGLLDNNLNAFIESLSGGQEKPQEEETETEQAPAMEKPGKKVVIEKLSITGSRMNLSITGAAALTGGGVIPSPPPSLSRISARKRTASPSSKPYAKSSPRSPAPPPPPSPAPAISSAMPERSSVKAPSPSAKGPSMQARPSSAEPWTPEKPSWEAQPMPARLSSVEPPMP